MEWAVLEQEVASLCLIAVWSGQCWSRWWPVSAPGRCVTRTAIRLASVDLTVHVSGHPGVCCSRSNQDHWICSVQAQIAVCCVEVRRVLFLREREGGRGGRERERERERERLVMQFRATSPIVRCPVVRCPVVRCLVVRCSVVRCPVVRCPVFCGQVSGGQVLYGQVSGGQVSCSQVSGGQVSGARTRFQWPSRPSSLNIGPAGEPGVTGSVLGMAGPVLVHCDITSWICFYLSVTAHTTVRADPSLKYTVQVSGLSATNKQ